MFTPILATKLYVPQPRPKLVLRPRLIQQLDEGLRQNRGFGRQLTLISAPAGFGKTTLIVEWGTRISESTIMHSAIRNPKLGWLSLDEADNDPIRFLTYFIAALQTVAENVGHSALRTLQAPQPPPAEGILTTVINEIAAFHGRIILVFDDYHLIEAQPIHDAVTFLLDHLPPQLHLVIATREDPLLPLARLRAQNQLTELRAMDLRFTSSEAAEFLKRVMGLDLSAEDIATLETRTEGWIAGLQLAALSMQRHKDASSFIKSFTGSHHFILDYLLEEVLEQQPESVQTFLLHTAVLDRLCAPLCDAVVGRLETGNWRLDSRAQAADNPELPIINLQAQEILEYLEHANLFIIPLDQQRHWYRYHHLFADLLQRRLRQTQPKQAPTLHIRASEWYELNGFDDEAIDYALRAEAFERAAGLTEELAESVWGRGEHTKLWGWLKALPADQVSARPRLCIFRAWILFANGKQQAAELSLQAAEQALNTISLDFIGSSPEDSGQPPDLNQVTLQGRVAAIRAFMASFRGDAPEIIQYARQALEYLPKQDSVWRSSAAIVLGDAYSFTGEMAAAYQARLEALNTSNAAGNIYLILIASLKLAVTLRQQGRLQRVIEICQQQSQLATESGLSQTAMAGSLFAVWGEVLAEQNDLTSAIEYASKGVELNEQGHDVAALGWSYLCLVRVLFATGDVTGAETIMRKMEKTGRESEVPPWITNLMAAWQVRVWLAQGKSATAVQWARERGLYLDGDLTFLREVEYMVLARILIAQDRFDEAQRLLARLVEATEAGGRTTRMLETLILQALALEAGGDTTGAMASLKQALVRAEPGGYIRIFADEGPPLVKLLQQAAARGIAVDNVSKLLAAFPADVQADIDAREKESPPTPLSPHASPLIEPLSERELEVLHLIADGLTNQKIGSKLFLTLNTVKVHTRNIYGKLNVHSRTQAIARAQELGLL